MTSNLFLGKPSAMRLFLLLVSVLCLSTFGMAQDAKDILIDEPADKVEDVFDEDTYDDLDDDYDDHKSMEETDREKPSPNDACIVKESCPSEATEREKPTPHSGCIKEEAASPCAAVGTSENPLVVELRELYDHPEEYYGKTVTVEAEIDDTFNENVFTVQDNGYENMVIKTGPACSAVELLKDDEWKDGRPIRVTGVVEPYDRAKLECDLGPLDMERKEGDQFTKAPVLIIRAPQTAQLAPPPVFTPEPEIISEAPAPPEEPEVAIAIIEEPVFEAPEEPVALPRTASGLPLAGIAGLLSLFAAAGFRFYRR
jgi:hypothetical protein